MNTASKCPSTFVKKSVKYCKFLVKKMYMKDIQEKEGNKKLQEFHVETIILNKANIFLL